MHETNHVILSFSSFHNKLSILMRFIVFITLLGFPYITYLTHPLWLKPTLHPRQTVNPLDTSNYYYSLSLKDKGETNGNNSYNNNFKMFMFVFVIALSHTNDYRFSQQRKLNWFLVIISCGASIYSYMPQHLVYIICMYILVQRSCHALSGSGSGSDDQRAACHKR